MRVARPAAWPNGSRYTGDNLFNEPGRYGPGTTANGTNSGLWRVGCFD